MSASISNLIAELQPYARALVDIAGAAGLQPRITSTRRSSSEQRRLFDRFLAGANPYPVAPPGTSAHEYGFAFDMIISPMAARGDENLADLGTVWKRWGGIWGGKFNDPIHFEYPGFAEYKFEHDAEVLEKTTPHWYDYLADLGSLAELPALALDLAGIALSKEEAIKFARRYGIHLTDVPGT